MEANVINLNNGYGVALTLCTNAEVLDAQNYCGDLDEDVADEAVRVANSKICEFLPRGEAADCSSRFEDWRGGRFAGASNLHVRYYRQHVIKEEGEEDETEWKYVANHMYGSAALYPKGSWMYEAFLTVPTELRERIEKLQNDVDEAMAAVIAAAKTDKE